MQAYAKPMGVIAGIMPVTNGEATPIVKSNMALKTRNAIILAPHPKCKKLNVEIVDKIRAVLKKLGYPEDLRKYPHSDKIHADCYHAHRCQR